MGGENEKVQAKQAMRFKFLDELYRLSGGDTMTYCHIADIGANTGLGIAGTELDAIVFYLRDEGLVHFPGLSGVVTITHDGIVEVEQSHTEPATPTEHFPANVINIGTMIGSNIVQGSTNVTQQNTFSVKEKNALGDFIHELKAQSPKLQLDADSSKELDAEVATLEAQMESPNPKRAILKECLSSVRNILEGAAGGMVAEALLKHLPTLMAAIGLS